MVIHSGVGLPQTASGPFKSMENIAHPDKPVFHLIMTSILAKSEYICNISSMWNN